MAIVDNGLLPVAEVRQEPPFKIRMQGHNTHFFKQKVLIYHVKSLTEIDGSNYRLLGRF